MVTRALQEVVDALSVEDRISLLEYLERTTDVDAVTLTDEQLAVIDRRSAEMTADPSIGVSEDEFMARLLARWA